MATPSPAGEGGGAPLSPTRARPCARRRPAEREDGDEDHHLDEAEDAEAAEEQRPGVEEDHLDVEDDEEDGREVELDGEAAPRRAAGHVPALERLLLHDRRASRREDRRRREEEARYERGQHQHRKHRDVLELHGRSASGLGDRPRPVNSGGRARAAPDATDLAPPSDETRAATSTRKQGNSTLRE